MSAGSPTGSNDQTIDDSAVSSASGDPRTPATAPGTGGAGAAGVDVGARLGRYHLRERLGEGGMGAVFAAHDPALDRTVAVKVLRSGVGSDSDEPHLRLEREGRVMARLSHPNVIQVFDVGYAQGSVFVAMEYVRGGTLKDWLAAEPRSVPEILAVFVQAARGLAAAHDAGFVHRDFKPSNVMVSDDGRVLVTDFGLARVAENAEPTEPTDGDPLHVTLTHANTIIGTPQYMAPEQYQGGVVDARADQFGFCVALWQALHGVAPFPGTTWRELAASVREGKRTEPPAATLPPRVRAALERGLSVDREARFPSMHALVAALAPPAPPRRAWWIALAAVALVGAGFAAWAIARDRSPAADPCVAASDRFAGVWDAAESAAVRDAFAATGAPFAATSHAEVARQLDERRAAWEAMREGSCRATVRKEQSDAALDLRAACLDRRFAELAAFVAVLRAPDRKVVESAPERAGRVGDVAGCADVEALGRRAPLPTGADLRDEIAAIERALATVRARAEAGHGKDVAAEATTLLERARQAGYAPVLGESLAVNALIAQEERPADAERFLEEAVLAAEAGGDDAQRFDLELLLVQVVGTALERDEDGTRHVERATALQQRLGADPRREARLARLASMHDWTHGRYGAARGHAERAVKILEGIDPEGPELARALIMLAIVFDDLNDASAELPVIERAIALAAEAFGPQHPVYARAKQTQSGALRRLDRVDEAEVAIREAIVVFEATDGPRSSVTAGAYMNLGNVQRDKDDLPAAIVSFRKALEVMEAAVGPDHTRTANVLDNLGGALSKNGDYDEGERLLRRSVEVYTARIGADAPPTAGAVRHLAEHHVRKGELAEAIPLYEEAIRAVEASDGKTSRMLVRPLLGLGETYLAKGDKAKAITVLERCLAVVGDDEYHADLKVKCEAALAASRGR